jgi:hypothetical protein
MLAHEMQRGMLEVPAVGAPQVAITVKKDLMNGWNVTVMTDNFNFTPKMVNSENLDNTGHTHLYVDGIKIARLYGHYFHIPQLSAGDHEVTVNLASNDHSYYMVDGDQIEARTMALLQNWRLRRAFPFPLWVHATRTISAVPRAGKRFISATRIFRSRKRTCFQRLPETQAVYPIA